METNGSLEEGEGGIELVADNLLVRLRNEIMNGELAPGAKISEPEVARRHGVSRAPLREALRRLEERGLVTRMPRLGARVVVLSPESIQQIFLMREAIEGMAAREAAKHITDSEIALLRAQLEHQRDRFSRIGAVEFLTKELDNDFHSAIAHASRNEFLIRFLCEDYRDLINLCRLKQRRNEARGQRALIEHSRIVDALEERDPDLAELMMRRHVAAARRGMISMELGSTESAAKTRPG